jgi:hypothetical protein
MKVVKLDRRYAGYPRWNYMLQFPLTGREKHKQYFQYVTVFRNTFGLDCTINPDREALDYSKPVWLYNDNWYGDFKRQRILFKDQAVMSMILLKMPG